MSELTLYKTEITPSKNMWIDHLSSYLDTLPTYKKYSVSDFQYFNPKLKNEITILMHQSDYLKGGFNYIKLVENSATFYYFIVDFNWTSTESVKLTIVLDTVNTFNFSFTDKTKIIRQHLDRFENPGSFDMKGKLKRKIYKFSEGLNPILYLQQKGEDTKKLLIDPNDALDDNYYLYYRNKDKPAVDKNENPVECFLVSDNPILIKREQTGSPPVEYKFNDLTRKWRVTTKVNRFSLDTATNPSGEFQILKAGTTQVVKTYRNDEFHTHIICQEQSSYNAVNQSYQVWTVTYKLEANKYVVVSCETSVHDEFTDEANTIRFIQAHSLGVCGVDNIAVAVESDYYVLRDLDKRATINVGGISRQETISVKDIYRANPRNLDLFLLPYAPDDFGVNDEGELVYDTNKWFYTEGMLRLNDLSAEFERKFLNPIGWSYKDKLFINKPVISLNNPSLRHIKYESQLFHSDYFKYKVIYDSFSTDIYLENCNARYTFVDFDLSINVTYKVSNTINSNMLFELDFYPVDFESTYDYPFLIIVNRNNSMPLYNSAYVDYVKNGYNYDKKQAERQKGLRWLNTGLQAGVGLMSLAFSGVTGGLSLVAGAGFITSSISSTANNINATMTTEENLNRRLESANNTAVNVSGNNAVDLMKYYTENRLALETWRISEVMQHNLNDLFYFYGNSYPYNGMPKTDTRTWFNYIQCDPVFDIETTAAIRNEFLTDLENRFKLGVTKYHNVLGKYDFEQKYENWEVWLTNEN